MARFVNLLPECICHDEAEWKLRRDCFLRDMAMQGIKVSYQKQGNVVTCPETGHRWAILS